MPDFSEPTVLIPLHEPRPAEVALDKDYMAEPQLRVTLMGIEETVRKDDSNPFLCDPDFLQRVIQDFCQSHPERPCVILHDVDSPESIV
jgi:hypothetical protein